MIAGQRNLQVWGGHSCPPHLRLLLLFLLLSLFKACLAFDGTGHANYDLRGQNIKINVKGGGQECPPYTNM